MWIDRWCLLVAPDLPPSLQALLKEHFNAWMGDSLCTSNFKATVGNLSSAEAATLLAAAAVQPLPGAWPHQTVGLIDLGDHRWGLRCEESACVVAWPERTCCDVRCHGPHAALLLLVALTEAFRASGWLTVHASGYQTPEGGMCLCLGRSGTGKSVRALKSVADGCRFVGEDRVWLRAEDLLVVPRDRRVRLLPAGAAAVSGLPLHQASTDPDGKLRFPLELLGVTPADPSAVCEIEVLVGPVSTRLPSTQDEPALAAHRLRAVQAIWEAFGIPFVPAARAHTVAAVRMMMRLPIATYARSEHVPYSLIWRAPDINQT